MFHGATSLSAIAWPRRGLSGSGCTACGPVAPSGMPSADFAAMPAPLAPVLISAHARTASAAAAIAPLSLADVIAHLAFLIDGPGLDAVVVLHEAGNRARLLDLRHARLHVARTVERAAHEDRRRAVPVPARFEACEGLVHDRLFQHRLAPRSAAVGRDIDRANLPRPRPGEPADLLVAGRLEPLPARRRGDDGLALHHHAELAPLAIGHRIGIARGLAAEVPRLVT